MKTIYINIPFALRIFSDSTYFYLVHHGVLIYKVLKRGSAEKLKEKYNSIINGE